MPRPARLEVILAYRHIYKSLLRAVQYSKPARYMVQERVRKAFRNSSEVDFNAPRIARTLEFVDGAVKTTGLEHKILRNLLHVWWLQRTRVNPEKIQDHFLPFRQVAYDDFNDTIKKLNETMGLCIK